MCIDCGGPSEGKRCLVCEKARRIREAKGWTDPKTGRVWIRCPGHPRASKYKHNLVLRAVLVLEAKIGRRLNWPLEVAHHINEDKRDDRPENLEVRLRGAHTSSHIQKCDIPRDELVKLYVEQGFTLKQVGEKYGLHLSTVALQMRAKNIPRRKGRDAYNRTNAGEGGSPALQ